MKITLSVKGRFHAFNLAEQIQKNGFLQRLITTYPSFEVKKYGIKQDLIKSLFVHEVLVRIWRKCSKTFKLKYNLEYFLKELFDLNVVINIKKNDDIFVGFSSNSLHSIRKAKKNGIITILERGSSHISYQNELLIQEYEKLGIKHNPIPRKIISKELKEYDEADYISIPSSFVEKSFLDQGIDPRKLIKVPYGVDIENFIPMKKDDDVFRVVFCGALSVRKGVHYLLQAFSELNLPNSELILIGERQKEMEPFLQKYQRDNIKCKGTFPEKELYKHYSEGSVFCLPSIEDGFGMVLGQALACGLPIICTENTGGPDLIENGKEGFIIPIRDVEKLKEKILILYKNPDLLKSMSEGAIRKAQKATWNEYGDRMINLYENLVENKCIKTNK
ncbi:MULTISPECIES: glycosyltransferase family 4 protein [Priestia]|uniref:glycosyltransferase family 4 protein n=1 Tax=Priestia TaxID=2800373 RepID=UPI00112EF3D4|nr:MULTISPECIES: glycosyltransferase family 4 protein [Priestia]